jgi:hypothetical protein
MRRMVPALIRWQQRTWASDILREARDIARDDFGGLQQKVMRRLRADPALQAIESQLVAVGDAYRTGAVAWLFGRLIGDRGWDAISRRGERPLGVVAVRAQPGEWVRRALYPVRLRRRAELGGAQIPELTLRLPRRPCRVSCG